MGNNNGGPAFPIHRQELSNGDSIGPEFGMSLRDWFAGHALNALIRSNVTGKQMTAIVDEAFYAADLMVLESQRGQ